MNQYILIMCWIGFAAILANIFNLQKSEILGGEVVERYNWWFAFLVFVPIIWMAGHRDLNLGDTSGYVAAFQGMPSSFAEIPSALSGFTKDRGFYILTAILKVLIGDRYVWYLLILALIQGVSVMMLFRRYSSAYIISVFLFVASTDYISWMFNGLRQFMAVTIILFATPLMLKRKYIPLILVILLASTMHQSALIMIPFVLIAQGEAWNKRTLLCIAAALLAIVFVGQFTNLLDSVLQTTQYKNVVNDYTAAQDDGTSPLRVIIYSIPTILAFIGRKTIREENSRVINFCVNMSIISTGLYALSMVTSGIFMGRLPIYVSLYSYVLLPWEIDHLFTADVRKIVRIAMIACYLVFYLIQMRAMQLV